MLTFEEKLTIIESFPELKRNDISLRRVNFHFEESVKDKQIVVYRLHPNGNGFVYAELIEENGYVTDSKGMVNIRDFTKEELQQVIKQSIASLSEAEPFEETWINAENQTLQLMNEYDVWNIYAGNVLDGTHTTYHEAADYLYQEGFNRIQDIDAE
ncbi:hypothetical protein GCM10007063_17830 [Lentibacillus kapialis]|uniref:Uncharacterized protein n=1 Tax=Lentibacillus kapialis TaxID=340214 RepID=A0A917PWU9_9BACI|nr:hypothetical protein [Lentibacillus kapialis]GGJ95808.1 hypothetical protein GCM10007063_17830 [Lentibacillus kapialis]